MEVHNRKDKLNHKKIFLNKKKDYSPCSREVRQHFRVPAESAPKIRRKIVERTSMRTCLCPCFAVLKGQTDEILKFDG